MDDIVNISPVAFTTHAVLILVPNLGLVVQKVFDAQGQLQWNSNEWMPQRPIDSCLSISIFVLDTHLRIEMSVFAWGHLPIHPSLHDATFSWVLVIQTSLNDGEKNKTP